jgi:cobalt/nickel transport system permease protein
VEKVAAAMVTWHVLIGIGEALITGLVVGSVIAVRPDLVYGARPALKARTLVVRESSTTTPTGKSA